MRKKALHLLIALKISISFIRQKIFYLTQITCFNMTKETRMTLGGLFGALSVAFGAFGAHALKAMLETSNRADTFETACKYMMYHALLLLITGALSEHGILKLTGWLITIGIVIFCGALYTICFTGVTLWGAVAPLGGLCFILAWLSLAVYGAKLYKYNSN